MENEISVQKSGEQILAAEIRRTVREGGLLISVRAHPSIEEFFAQAGQNEKAPISKFGRMWSGKGGAELQAWTIYTGTGVFPTVDISGYYCLDRVGGSLYESRTFPLSGVNTTQEVLNMSFLRLCGISEGSGVEFLIKGVYSPQAIKQLAEHIKYAGKAFYASYLKPVNVYITVSSQQGRPE